MGRGWRGIDAFCKSKHRMDGWMGGGRFFGRLGSFGDRPTIGVAGGCLYYYRGIILDCNGQFIIEKIFEFLLFNSGSLPRRFISNYLIYSYFGSSVMGF